MNYFTFIKKCISYDSRNYPDLIVSELPPITTPPKRHEIIYIDGVDGGMVQEKGYGTYEKTMLISLRRAIDIDDITFLLSGSGEIEFSNELGKLYRVTILNQIDYNRLGRFRTASVVFLAQPHKILKDEKPVFFSGNPGNVDLTNQGNATAYPLISLEGMTGMDEITLTHYSTAGTYELTVNIPSGTVIIDCEKQNLYHNGQIKNRYITGDFFTLPPKSTTEIDISGTGSYDITFNPRSRFI